MRPRARKNSLISRACASVVSCELSATSKPADPYRVDPLKLLPAEQLFFEHLERLARLDKSFSALAVAPAEA